MIGAIVAICRVALGASDISATGTNGVDAIRIRAEFSGIAQPIHYESNTKRGDHFTLSWIELNAGARTFGEKYTAKELIYSLWPWLDDAGHAPEATIMLLGVTGRQMMRSQKLTYVDSGKPGNWASLAPGYIDECKIACRLALSQPDEWYPHQVLFDRDAVLAESKTNALTRANYIGAMQKALADPKIRTENPLGVEETLNLLCSLGATEARSTFLDYLFFDWKAEMDYRIGTTTGSYPGKPDVYHAYLPCIAYLARMGSNNVPMVLQRFADTSVDERLIGENGGGSPVAAIRYFYLLGFTENQAIKSIEDFRQSKRGQLTDKQIEALQEIVDVIKEKRHRPDYFKVGHPDWAEQKGSGDKTAK